MSELPYQPPPGDYFDLSPRGPGTPNSPFVRLHQTRSAEHSPLVSPDPYNRDQGYSSRLSLSETARSQHNFPPDIEIQSLIQQRSGLTSGWGVHWWPSFCMVALFVSGVVGAITHHAFYQSLDGHEAKSQLWMGRIGTGMAFYTKASLVGSVVLSYKQRIWYSLRRRGMTVGAIDGLQVFPPDCSFQRLMFPASLSLKIRPNSENGKC
jgi:hypothetical protein